MKCIIITIAAGLALTSCGALKETSKKVRKETETRADLGGKWTSKCLPSTTPEGKFAILKYDFSAPTQTYTFHKDVYAEADCKTLETSYVDQGSYTLPNAVKTGSQNIDINLKDITVSPRTDDQAKQYNAEQYCGFTDWQSGYAKSMIGNSCQGFPFHNASKVHNLFDVRQDSLYLGEPDLFTAPTEEAKRPKSVNLDVPFSKK